jgi:hypothetical protein
MSDAPLAKLALRPLFGVVEIDLGSFTLLALAPMCKASRSLALYMGGHILPHDSLRYLGEHCVGRSILRR